VNFAQNSFCCVFEKAISVHTEGGAKGVGGGEGGNLFQELLFSNETYNFHWSIHFQIGNCTMNLVVLTGLPTGTIQNPDKFVTVFEWSKRP
jgi:hypothetical protein